MEKEIKNRGKWWGGGVKGIKRVSFQEGTKKRRKVNILGVDKESTKKKKKKKKKKEEKRKRVREKEEKCFNEGRNKHERKEDKKGERNKECGRKVGGKRVSFQVLGSGSAVCVQYGNQGLQLNYPAVSSSSLLFIYFSFLFSGYTPG